MSAVGNLFKAPKAPALPTPTPAPEIPTVDTARQEAEAQMLANQRRGVMANIFANTNTGADLGANTANAGGAMKKLLGK